MKDLNIFSPIGMEYILITSCNDINKARISTTKVGIGVCITFIVVAKKKLHGFYLLIFRRTMNIA